MQNEAQITEIKQKVDKEHGIHLLKEMKRIRRFEDMAAEMYTKEKIRGFLHLYIGEEAVAVGAMQALDENDNILCTYREHGHALVRGISANSIMAELYGKQEGCSHGRGGSMHLFDSSKKFFGGTAIVGDHIPLTVGMALAQKKKRQQNISCCFFGEGAMAEGIFHESMNLASLLKVPALFICENNYYAMGTALKYSHSMQQLEKKGAAYNIQSEAVDGMDVLAVEEAAQRAVKHIRETGEPYFLVCNTYRFRAHSMFDAELYRDKSEVEEWKKKDPIQGLIKVLKEQGLITDEEIGQMDNDIEKEMQEAVDFAEAGTWEPIGELMKYVRHNNSPE